LKERTPKKRNPLKEVMAKNSKPYQKKLRTCTEPRISNARRGNTESEVPRVKGAAAIQPEIKWGGGGNHGRVYLLTIYSKKWRGREKSCK